MADELTVVSSQVPARIEELVQFVKVGREKLTAVRAEIRAIEKLGLEDERRKQALEEAQALSEQLLDAEVSLGEIMATLPEAPGKRTDLEAPGDIDVPRSKKEILKEAGFSVKTAQRYEMLAAHPEIVAQMKAEARDKGAVVSRTAVLRAITKVDNPEVNMPVHKGDEEDERCITRKYMSSVRITLQPLTLDPCCERQKHDFMDAGYTGYSKSQNGLKQDWSGAFSHIWMFPPYYDVKRFVDKLLSSKFGAAIVLVANETETTWFKRLAELATAMLFHDGKMNFKIPEGKKYTGPERGMVFFYFGNDPDRFLENFSQYGFGIKLRENMADEIRHPTGIEELMNRPMTEEDKEIVKQSIELNKKAEERHKDY